MIRTLWLVQESMDAMWLPVEQDWRVNERHYGMLQGLDKTEVAEHYGAEQEKEWRRGFAVSPPALNPSDPRHPRFDGRYRGLSPDMLPATESLEKTMRRVLEVWDERILPRLRMRKRILIVAHGNTLRALIKHLEGIPDEEISELNIPTGMPRLYKFKDDLTFAQPPKYLDEAAAKAGAEAVKKQAG